jgi:hypothetical protein
VRFILLTYLITHGAEPFLRSCQLCSENDVILQIHHIGNYEKFSCINHNLQCYNENEDCEEATVEQIAVKHQKTSEDLETDGDMIERE